MSQYTRIFLHFLHVLTERRRRVHTFVFGTRLTRTTRLLKSCDPDIAVAQVVREVQDWSGGTRIATCLHEFNQRWARRLLGANAAVLLVTDGLDRDEHGDLGAAAARLRRLAHQVVWLNPLLRFDGYAPLARGAAALHRHAHAQVALPQALHALLQSLQMAREAAHDGVGAQCNGQRHETACDPDPYLNCF